MHFNTYIYFFLCLLVDFGRGDTDNNLSTIRVKRQRPKSCSKNQYKCFNGQCVASGVVCNGIKNCLDGSDEAWEACEKKYPNSCLLPPNLEDKSFIINCDSSTTIKIFPSSKGDFVQELTLISFTCNADYTPAGQQFQSVCLGGKWTPQFADCVKTCEKVHISSNANAKCSLHNQEVDCKKTLYTGTVIQPQCGSNFNPSVEEAVCDKNGKWNSNRIECLGCGTSLNTSPPFQYPWNVAIYLREFSVLVCAGTILSPHIILTAASCFDSEKIKKPNNYVVVVGKKKRKLHEKDTQYQREYAIQRIHTRENYQDDIKINDLAIVELTENIVYNSGVYSVCVDWDRKNPSLRDDFPGFIANYYVNEELGTANTSLYIPSEMEIFFHSNVPLLYISKNKCMDLSPSRMRGLITDDKFCAKKLDNQPILIIDTGTGFVIEHDNKYYLEGVASGVFSPFNTFRVFTDISRHFSWITPFLKTTVKTRKPSIHTAVRIPDVVPKDEIFVYDSLRINCTAGDIYTEFVDGCILPNKNLYNIDYEVTCSESVFQSYCNQSIEGAPIPQYTSLKYRCRNGFASYSPDTSASVCFQGKWTPPIAQCSRICRKLKPENVVIQCKYEGRNINCEDKLIVNTEVIPVSCQPEYRKNATTDSGPIYCRENGQWSGPLLQCVPICGHPSKTKITPTIHGGEDVILGEFPWHAAIYEKPRNYTLICGATIISEFILLSAAHCFYDRNNNRNRKASDYEIGVSKISRQRNIMDSETTQFYEIEALIFNNFRGLQLRFQRDIVIVVTKIKISFNSQVSPVCLFKDPNTKIAKEVLLDIPGWGIDETGHPGGSHSLKVTHLPFLSFDDCSKIAPESLASFLSTEKFCTGHVNASTLDKGDSGGGLVLKNSIDSSYYLVGIVSFRATDESYISLSTYVLEYLSWIMTNLNEIHKIKNSLL